MDYPDEVFPEYEQIVFDAPEAFAEKAERFLADDERRRRIARRMHEIVAERFGYRAALARFLAAMRDYLRERACPDRP